MSTTTRFLTLMAVMALAACTVKDTPAPPLAGPSELALRLGLQVVPDSILQDGASQAVLSIDASNGDGRAARGLALRVEIMVDGVIADYGTLSSKTVVTGDDGKARVIYTAPPRPAEPVDEGNRVMLRVIPIGSDYGGEQARFVLLRLVTPGVILPPNSAPIPEFTSSGNLVPSNDIVFDASPTTDEGLPCGSACTYTWDFGDGSTGTGIFVRHQYREAKTYQLKLTATDVRGASATLARPMQIGPATPPTAAFTYSPVSPITTNQTIFFNAEGSRAATGRRVARYDWNFGNGRTDSGVLTTFSYPTAGNYVVTLIVTDDIGEKSTPATQTVTVGAAPLTLTASLVTLPATSAGSAVSLATTVFFDASGSAGPARIVEYRFNMGDGTPDVVQTTLPSWSYRYTAGGIYNARVTVRDSEGRTATATRTVYVQ
jgi:PKD repeat protein